MDEGLIQVQAMATPHRLPADDRTAPVGMTIAGMQSLTGKTTLPD
jgi:hypothetical protein